MRKPRLMSKMKRIEIALETARRDEVLKLIEQHATGYSIVPNVTGFGEHGFRDGHMTLIVAVVTDDHMEAILDLIMPVLKERSGIVTVTDVRVVRPEHFMPEVRAFTAKQPPRIDP